MPINLLKKPGTQSPWCCSWGYSDMLVEIDFFVHKFLLDNCLRIIEKEKKTDDYILCWASPGCCSRGSPSGWREMSLLQNLKIIEKWEILTKNYDDWSISGWEIEKRRFHHNIPCAPSPWCCSWGSLMVGMNYT